MSLIERLEAVAGKLEAHVKPSSGESLYFSGYLPVWLNDGTLKVHQFRWWGETLPVHFSDDCCSVMTVEEYEYSLDNPVAIG